MANLDVTGKLINSGGGALVPIGCILPYAGISIPDNWLYCAGLEVSRTEYAELFAVLGDRFGAGNGSTTFNIPDLREKFIFGANPGNPSIASYTIGVTGGEATHTLTINEMPRHNHNVYIAGNGGGNWTGVAGSPSNQWAGWNNDYIQEKGNSQPHNNMPPYACYYYIIRAK